MINLNAMKNLLLFALLVSGASLAAQTSEKGQPATPPVPAVTGVSTGQPFYAMDDAAKLHVRDLEYKANQLEIEIQTMRAKIEEDKAAEAAVWKDIQTAASQYAKDHSIDTSEYDFDAIEAKFPRKKKP